MECQGEKLMSISAVGRALGRSTRTIKRLEKRGAIPAPVRRGRNGLRWWSEEQVGLMHRLAVETGFVDSPDKLDEFADAVRMAEEERAQEEAGWGRRHGGEAWNEGDSGRQVPRRRSPWIASDAPERDRHGQPVRSALACPCGAPVHLSGIVRAGRMVEHWVCSQHGVVTPVGRRLASGSFVSPPPPTTTEPTPVSNLLRAPVRRNPYEVD
jgi:hypothetical protein